MKDDMLIIASIMLVIALLLGVVLIVVVGEYWGPMPRCQEDSVIIGQGDFDNGRWEYYSCGPALDNYHD